MRLTTTAAVAAVGALLTLTPAASADRADLRPRCAEQLIRSANHHRAVVIKRHGKRAPGRDIVRYGRIGANQQLHRVSCKTLHRYRRQLIQLRTEPKLAPLLYRTAVAPHRPPAGVQTPSVAAGGVLAAIRQCESGGNYSTNTGNGFYGAYQFTQSTWESVGGVGNPAAASPAEQDRRAAILYAQQGASPWPVCGR